jgi:hypothetical protein
MASVEERLARVRALMEKPLEDFDQSTAGTNVAGEVVEMGEAESEFGTFPVITVDDGTRLVRIACARTKVRNWVYGHDVRVGDVIALTYLGQRPMKNGKKFHDFRCHHDPAEKPAEPPRLVSAEALDEEPPYDEDVF